jgi:glycerol uptake facilitator-like aquaporin
MSKSFQSTNYINICEFIGSMFLVIAAIAPMILFTEIINAPVYIAIIADALAVGFVLFALIETFGPICTAYFNPAVSFAMAINKRITWFQAARYSFFQVLGGFFGVLFSHLMFFDSQQTILTISSIERGGGTYLAEIIGTFILVLCIFSLIYQKSDRISLVVGLLVGGMLLSTSSTMFANPQVTISRIFTSSAAGINPFDGAIFVLMQLIGAILAIITWKIMNKICITANCKI